MALEVETPRQEQEQPSMWVAFVALLRFSFQRQARAREMVLISLLLIVFITILVGYFTMRDKWHVKHWRTPYRSGPRYGEIWDEAKIAGNVLPREPGNAAVYSMYLAATRAVLDASGFMVFSNWIVFSLFVSFLLPIWSLSFATESIGGELEARSLIWLLTRPMPRALIYLARFLSVLPWVLGLNLGGFLIVCLAAGKPGWLAFRLYWPAVLWSSLAFAALFHAMGAMFRRPAVVAIVYSFFLETFLGNLPGYMKRISIGFYTRCMMFEEARSIGVECQPSSVFLPVDSLTAWLVLMSITVGLLAFGMAWFARAEYVELG